MSELENLGRLEVPAGEGGLPAPGRSDQHHQRQLRDGDLRDTWARSYLRGDDGLVAVSRQLTAAWTLRHGRSGSPELYVVESCACERVGDKALARASPRSSRPPWP